MIRIDALVFLMRPVIRFWNKAPFIRLLLPLMAGIIIQWYLPFTFDLLLIVMISCIFIILLYFFFSLKNRFRFAIVHGVLVNIMVFSAGSILVWINDIRHDDNWFGNHYKNESIVIAQLEEPVIEKPNSYKALSSTQHVSSNTGNKTVNGKAIIYFQKDSSLKSLNYAARIVFRKSLQEIKNSGNPGTFDYKTYCLFNGITHQVYLSKKDFIILPEKQNSFFKSFIFDCRSWVLKTIRQYILQKKEQGLAEALLIGYKDDLDKNLVQSYSNTGVVHVIAISGLHLGLIYWLLIMLTRPLSKNKKTSFIRLVLIILCLWWFSILAGAQPSVLRSAVMFSFLAAAEVLSRRTSIYNTLALSAFFLLCYNPFWLWDVGFQLSYTAVISIVAFFRPVYNLFYCKNKLVDMIWKLNAVTISAQLLTLPISMYHFHQVPTLFLFTNLVAVPLSSVILFAEIILCLVFFIEPVANILGSLIQWLIWLMNSYIERFDQLPFSIWDKISVNISQTIFLSACVIFFMYWLMENKRIFMWATIAGLLGFTIIESFTSHKLSQQKKLIVYNVPKHKAIKLVSGNEYFLIGDSMVKQDKQLQNFHIMPSHVMFRLKSEKEFVCSRQFIFNNQRILLIDSSLKNKTSIKKDTIDLLILSSNPKLYISQLHSNFVIRKIIIDGSVPQWKSRLWKKDCDSLRLSYHDVSEKGAFVMNL